MAVRIGISACLLGMRVRYDGGHKAWTLAGELALSGVTFIPLCPEVDCGLGVPREPMRLEGVLASPVIKTLATHVDHTQRLINWSATRLDLLVTEGVQGFLFKSRSPSCGIMDVPVYDSQGILQPVGGVGLFARACQRRFPGLLMAEGDKIVDWQMASAFLSSIAVSGSGRGGSW